MSTSEPPTTPCATPSLASLYQAERLRQRLLGDNQAREIEARRLQQDIYDRVKKTDR